MHRQSLFTIYFSNSINFYTGYGNVMAAISDPFRQFLILSIEISFKRNLYKRNSKHFDSDIADLINVTLNILTVTLLSN